ncbi:DUF3099 domain-containing protein [Streptomyces sp. NPDC057280]|uniref:DUF3099 domain-containing protein n=1 Tax=Streptomyces sp. NPDC057280 TaxID=3346081 RepID=UPI0009A3E7C5|nr:hypothetical protein B1R27_05200 [Streptomyces sp. GKU 895]
MNRTSRQRDTSPAESITRARTGLSQDLRGRQRRYVTAMLVRSACVVVMALTWNRWPPVAFCALAGGVVIPYVAVVAAQAGWRQQRGVRPELARPAEESAARIVLEPTLILPPEPDRAT